MLQNIDVVLFIIFSLSLPHSQLASNRKLLSEDIQFLLMQKITFFIDCCEQTPLHTILIANDS